jgi:hypothetical protein
MKKSCFFKNECSGKWHYANLKYFLILLTVFSLASCEKDKDTKPGNQNSDYKELNQEQISVIVEGATVASTQMQTFMYNSLFIAADSGYSVQDPPDVSSSMVKGNFIGNQLKASAELNNGWTGPDADGWYTLYMSNIYDYTEKVRLGDTVEYIRTIEYHGGDGSYKNETTTKYIPYHKNDSLLYKGYSIWTVDAFGDNDISKSEWRIEFEDWNPNTNAGIFDWYWGVSENSGGNTVPLHRYEHLEATETTPTGWLHCHFISYDDNGDETWDFEYDTPWVPVVMPEIPNVTFE